MDNPDPDLPTEDQRSRKRSSISTIPGHRGKARKRSTLACDTCRSRRTKCDGQRPRCHYCRTHAVECCYQEPPQPPASKVELELAAVNKRLDHLTRLLTLSQKTSPPYIDGHDDDQTEKTLRNVSPELPPQQGSPFKLLGTSSVLRTLGLDPDFGHTLIRMERTAFDASSRGYAGSRMLMMHHQKATGALAAFYEKIHSWYPILPLAFSEQYFKTLSGTLAPSAESCLTLLVAAVGCVVQDEELSSRGDLHERSDLVFFEAALASLPIVISECSLVSVQCALLFAIYYCSLMKPCQAHDYSLIASFKIQSLLKSFHGIISEDAEKSELTNRAYWAALLLENELGVQLDIAKSDLWKYDEYIPLPDCRRTWQFAVPVPESGPQAASPISLPSPGSIEAETSESYFLAEIAMRRMLHRCNTATRQTSDGMHAYAPGIALELEHQLESWYDYLPEIIRFSKREHHPISPGAASGSPQQCPLTTFLRVQYHCCKLSIYWPAIYQAILDGGASDQLLDHCRRFFDSYIQLMYSIVEAFQVCIVNRWTLFVRYETLAPRFGIRKLLRAEAYS
ncbi:hypothetical protein CDV55_103181 [Aspergillus turcosus]|uniref:Zn(2)-C6 fungal-type domain-containing protein n=1 Tax=Aspergillus turcosus TaxID=1245748 RepID=A0A229X2D4_9EURO|nr:hypothetical protein CDV55_103181 [Aspergillus turcosus]RLL99126.1 hypothetical protein CFD26_106529 [Aspergillus turcosus]